MEHGRWMATPTGRRAQDFVPLAQRPGMMNENASEQPARRIATPTCRWAQDFGPRAQRPSMVDENIPLAHQLTNLLRSRGFGLQLPVGVAAPATMVQRDRQQSVVHLTGDGQAEAGGEADEQ